MTAVHLDCSSGQSLMSGARRNHKLKALHAYLFIVHKRVSKVSVEPPKMETACLGAQLRIVHRNLHQRSLVRSTLSSSIYHRLRTFSAYFPHVPSYNASQAGTPCAWQRQLCPRWVSNCLAITHRADGRQARARAVRRYLAFRPARHSRLRLRSNR